MGNLDTIPQKVSIELETVKLKEETVEKISTLNDTLNKCVSDLGSAYLRKKELQRDLDKLQDNTEAFEMQFEEHNKVLQDILDELEAEYPRGQINLKEGTITYQPGVPPRTRQ